MQKLVFLMEPPAKAWDISSKAVNMCMNRFCIDEDAAFEFNFESLILRLTVSAFKLAKSTGGDNFDKSISNNQRGLLKTNEQSDLLGDVM